MPSYISEIRIINHYVVISDEEIGAPLGDVLDDLIEHSVRLIGKPVELMTKEDKIRAIQFLSERGALLITKSGDKIATLMLRLWNDDCFVEENTLTVNVTRLRRKLEGIGLRDIIVTKPGSGYLIP